MKNAIVLLKSLLICFLASCIWKQTGEYMPNIDIIPQPLDSMEASFFKDKCTLDERFVIRKIIVKNNAYNNVKIWCRDICSLSRPFLLYDALSKIRNDTIIEMDLIHTASGIPIEISQGKDSIIYFKSRVAESGFKFKYDFAVKVDSMGFERVVECQFIDVN